MGITMGKKFPGRGTEQVLQDRPVRIGGQCAARCTRTSSTLRSDKSAQSKAQKLVDITLLQPDCFLQVTERR